MHGEAASIVSERSGHARSWTSSRTSEEIRADVLSKAAATAVHGRSGDHSGPDVLVLLSRFYRHTVPDDLVAMDPIDLLGAALSHLRLAEHRPQGTGTVRCFTPTPEEHGWSCGGSVVEVVTDDMPFLVDSVMGELNRVGSSIQLIIHPQVVVRRDIVGTLKELLDIDAADRDGRPADAVVESWMHVQIGRFVDPAALRDLENAIRSVLRDVRDAVEDWPKMSRTAAELADELEARPPAVADPVETHETIALLRWLADDNFTFLGFREYDLVGEPGEEALTAVPASGLGILRGDRSHSAAFAKLPPQVRARAREPRVLVLTKANSRATVHRSAYPDYIGVKRFDEKGTVVGERRFLGLFTASAYTQSVQRIPVLRRKAHEVLEESGFAADSHNGKDLQQFLETYPRDELFQMSATELLDVALGVMHLQERRQTRLFLRHDTYGRFVSCLVYLPRDRYTTTVRLRMRDILGETYAATSIDYTARVSESILARLHFVVHVPTEGPIPLVHHDDLERRLAAAARSWDDDFTDAVDHQVPDDAEARQLRRRLAGFPEAYKEDFPARAALVDARQMVALGAEGMALNLYEPYGTDHLTRRFKIIRTGGPVSLMQVLPILQHMGVEVLDERPYELASVNDATAYIYDFGLRFHLPVVPEGESLKERFQDAFAAAWRGDCEPDGFNALVVRGGLTWRQVSLLRSYSRYRRQIGSPYSQNYVENVLTESVQISRMLVQLFETRFDPDFVGDRAQQIEFLVRELETGLDEVGSLAHDKIMRGFLSLVQASIRTNYFQPGADGTMRPHIAIKLATARIPDLPLPRPKFEVWVYSPRVEGVHLRFGSVARGGLRWSDRREDFRTEVLGLVKAQAVKNAVIVPDGAKGGFYAKRLPEPSDREAWLAEGIAAYRIFVSSLLDITDNLVGEKIIPPSRVVRHDGDDAYLVVAADKGTAAFSDIANEISQSYGFWLGDAFASGGSAGYDHKAMGITARGAWESVKRHFAELGLNTQRQEFTCVGIGDMSGDVFGNGLLLSEHIRLIAAFDHRHIFLDPDPATAPSFAERRRLFELAGSSWNDYDRTSISGGGGVYSRQAKSIPISAEVRRALAISAGIDRMPPVELLRAILAAPVDLLWNGGIGTYVKASTETNLDVGDKANDAIRVSADALRCRVIGEGGNLGFTQLGRIEAARSGIRVNSDAIDNSAGVDTSDHEVNIKILLDAAVRDGDLTPKQRNDLLAQMTEEVGALVLRDNYEQNVLLANARSQAPAMVEVHRRLITELERSAGLDRPLEFIPTDVELAERESLGEGLSGPELSVLIAYAKMRLAAELLESELPDEPWFRRLLVDYFPRALVERFAGRLDRHPLRREIIATMTANHLVNRGGLTFAFRCMEETGASAAEVARVFAVTRDSFDLPDVWRRIETLDNVAPTAAQSALYLESRRLVDRAARWLLQSRGGRVDVDAEIEHFGPDIARVAPMVPGMLLGAEQERLQRRTAEFEKLGAPRDIALTVAASLDVFSLLDGVEVARRTGCPVETVTALYFVISERYDIDRMLTRITWLPRGGRWAALARQALRSDLYGALGGLTEQTLRSTSETLPPQDRIVAWEEKHAEGLARARATLADIASLETVDLATLSVALRVMRTLVAQGRDD